MVAFYQNAADQGDAAAHVALGHIYLVGLRGVPQDMAAGKSNYREGILLTIGAAGHVRG